MNRNDILNNVKALLGISDTSQDNLLLVLIEKSFNDVKIFCNNSFTVSFPSELSSVIEDLAIVKYRKRGSEGLKSENQGDLSQTYDDEINHSMKQKLYKYRLLGVK